MAGEGSATRLFRMSIVKYARRQKVANNKSAYGNSSGNEHNISKDTGYRGVSQYMSLVASSIIYNSKDNR